MSKRVRNPWPPSRTKEWRSWYNAIQRCTNPNDKSYKNYGARGIVFQESWLNDFELFYSYIGECPEGYSLDRIDSNMGYIEGNLQWSDCFSQNQNCRRRKINKNRYKFVSETKEGNSFRSRFSYNGSTYYLGQYKTDTEAAIAAYLRYKEVTGNWPKYIENDLLELKLIKKEIL